MTDGGNDKAINKNNANPIKKAAVVTLGCKVNQYESQSIAAALGGIGFEAFCSLTYADLYVINTCSVTAEADKKSRQAIARVLKINPLASIIVLGCSSQNDASFFLDKPQVVAVFGTGGKIENVLNAAKNLHTPALNLEINTGFKKTLRKKIGGSGKGNGIDFGSFDTPAAYEDDMSPVVEKTRAYLKIQDGCDSFCTYCRVPYLRGRSRSRPIQSILGEAERLSESVKEIVLAGVDISAYGKDCGTSLLELIKRLKLKVRGRLSSLECGVITEDFLLALKDAGFCDHFHLSLQSGSDSVLKRMNRRYTAAEFLQKTELLRRHFPFAGITTDIIAGFSQETDAEHKETLEFVKTAGFADIHVFPFSPRKGTKAYGFEQLDKSLRVARAHEIASLRDELKKEFLQKNLGRTLEVYAEDEENGYVTGFTTNYIKVYTKLNCGELKPLKLTKLFKQGVIGE